MERIIQYKTSEGHDYRFDYDEHGGLQTMLHAIELSQDPHSGFTHCDARCVCATVEALAKDEDGAVSTVLVLDEVV